jgi:hypothetical protein
LSSQIFFVASNPNREPETAKVCVPHMRFHEDVFKQNISFPCPNILLLLRILMDLDPDLERILCGELAKKYQKIIFQKRSELIFPFLGAYLNLKILPRSAHTKYNSLFTNDFNFDLSELLRRPDPNPKAA